MRLAVIIVFAVGCSAASPGPVNEGPTDAAAASDATTGDDDASPQSHGPYPAPHPDPPQEISLGGAVLKSPKVVPITYEGDPFRVQIETLMTTIGAGEFWKAVATEYGVGVLTPGNAVRLTEAAPTTIDDADLKTWFQSMLDGTHPEFDAPDGQTVYVVYFPPGTTYTHGGATGCDAFVANDDFTSLPGGASVPYVAVPRCPALQGMSPWDSLVAVTSGKLYEASTDPHKDAWATVDADHLAWSFAPPFSEIGDLCLWDPNGLVRYGDIGSYVQRAWSNSAAKAGHNPCVPAPPTPYFNAAPVLTEDVPIAVAGSGGGTTKGVRVPVGETRTIEVDLFSDRPAPPWRVRVFDFNEVLGKVANLRLTLDKDQGQNGDKLKLTIQSVFAGDGGGARFILLSDDGTTTGFWFGYVGN